MRIVKHTSRFRRDYKREKSGRYAKRLDAELLEAVTLLAKDEPSAHRYFDHPLGGEWSDHRDCHIRPDLILIYRKPDDASLALVRLGSHSELGPVRSRQFSYIAGFHDKTRGSRGYIKCSQPGRRHLIF